MKLELIKFHSSLALEWDKFIQNDSLNGTFLHTRKFYNHNPLNELDDNSYLFYKKNKIIGVIPFNLITNKNVSILHSYLRATYGGFIVSKEAGIEEVVEMVERIIDEAKKLRVNEIIIRNPFRIFNDKFCDESDYAMWLNGFKIKYRELEVAVELGDKAFIESNYSDSARRSINKGKNILRVEESEEYQQFWSILEKNLSEKYDVKPTHNYNRFLELLRSAGSEKIKLFIAKHENEIIAGIVLFIINNTGIHAQYIASASEFQNLRPLNVIIDYIIQWGSEKCFSYFNLGMANENCGKIINYGLFKFKEGFGGRGVLRETMNLELKDLQVG